MRTQRTDIEIARSQVATPPEVVRLFWKILHTQRDHLDSVLDLGAGDGRFALGGHYGRYVGVELDRTFSPSAKLPPNATIRFGCAFEHENRNYSACVGNPPYLRHDEINRAWRNRTAKRISREAGVVVNLKCNLYVYFIFLGLLRTAQDGIVATVVPFEWVSRPSAAPLRSFIRTNKWQVRTYRFSDRVFEGVETTASISIVDKAKLDGKWEYHEIALDGAVRKMRYSTGSGGALLPYERRGSIWAMRGMSPGTQKVFTLSEGERIHAGLTKDDVLPCVTSFRAIPSDLTELTPSAFRKHFVETGAKCWLVKSCDESVSDRLTAYLESVPPTLRDTATCRAQEPWYRFKLFATPSILVSAGFTAAGPKVVANPVGARAVGAVYGVYAPRSAKISRLCSHIRSAGIRTRVVPHSKGLMKVEIRQLNSVLNRYPGGRGHRGH